MTFNEKFLLRFSAQADISVSSNIHQNKSRVAESFQTGAHRALLSIKTQSTCPSKRLARVLVGSHGSLKNALFFRGNTGSVQICCSFRCRRFFVPLIFMYLLIPTLIGPHLFWDLHAWIKDMPVYQKEKCLFCVSG